MQFSWSYLEFQPRSAPRFISIFFVLLVGLIRQFPFNIHKNSIRIIFVLEPIFHHLLKYTSEKDGCRIGLMYNEIWYFMVVDIWFWLGKILQFHQIFWWGNFVERHSFHIVAGESPKTMLKLCLSTQCPHQEMRWNYGIFKQCLGF